jgi:predicted DNA-binding protein (MmcQ/YjbR family)
MTVEKMREFCLSLPGTTEGIKWEDHLCFMVAEKMFCISGMEDSSGVSFKVTEEDFDLLTEREGIMQAGYMAKRQWVGVSKRSALKPKEWQHYLKQSYELVRSKLPKKVREELG